MRFDSSCCAVFGGAVVLAVLLCTGAAAAAETTSPVSSARPETETTSSVVGLPERPGLQVRRIWDGAPHNAFTDLVRFRDRFYCTFRESEGHVPRNAAGDGKIRILSSPDGDEWKSEALLAEEGVDLRDPKLSVMPDGRLMVALGGSVYRDGKLQSRRPWVSFSTPGGSGFTPPVPVKLDPALATQNDWLWRVTWHEGTGYGIVYQNRSTSGSTLHLVSSRDGLAYQAVKSFQMDGFPNEATIRFLPDGEMLAVVRREKGDQLGRLGRSRPPYREWDWRPMNIRLGGPDLLPLPDGTLLLGTRIYQPSPHTVLGELTPEGIFTACIELPSGGDNSYPGLLLHDNCLWVSYYSSHEGKSSIYLARIELPVCRKEKASR